jgi:hypothetical protein
LKFGRSTLEFGLNRNSLEKHRATVPIGPKLARPLEIGLTARFGSRGGNAHSAGSGTSDQSGEWRRDEAGHWAEGEAGELCTLIWGDWETMAHRGGAPRRGEWAEGSLRWQAGGEVRNAAEVVSECHNTTVELRDVKAAPDDGWRMLTTVVRSAAHDTKDACHGGSHLWSMATDCGDGEVHHIGAVLGVVPHGLGGQSGSLLTPVGSGGGWWLTLLAEKEVAGDARWPADEALWRRPSDGDPGGEERRGVALSGTEPVRTAVSAQS